MPRLFQQLLLRPCAGEVLAPEAEKAGRKGSSRKIGINHRLRKGCRLKVYLSVPMIANRALPRAQIIARAITDAGHTISSPWVLGAIEKADPLVVNIFQRDTGATEGSDAIVADVSEPSIGVGMELMAAYKAHKRIILVVKKGKVTSRMLMHMDRKETVEYDDEDEIYEALRGVL